LHELTLLLLDACGDDPLVNQYRRVLQQQAADEPLPTSDTTTLGAVVSLVHQHQAALMSRYASE